MVSGKLFASGIIIVRYGDGRHLGMYSMDKVEEAMGSLVGINIVTGGVMQ